MTHQALTSQLATAGVIGAEEKITAAQARRLACNAHLVPAVLGTQSQVLDLGRSTRLFTAAQRKALLVRDRECRAEGCDIPGTWTQAHHWIPWTKHGPTDLANAVLCCAPTITTEPTTRPTKPTDSPTATSASTDGREPQVPSGHPVRPEHRSDSSTRLSDSR
jgi:hypothetical protein